MDAGAGLLVRSAAARCRLALWAASGLRRADVRHEGRVAIHTSSATVVTRIQDERTRDGCDAGHSDPELEPQRQNRFRFCHAKREHRHREHGNGSLSGIRGMPWGDGAKIVPLRD